MRAMAVYLLVVASGVAHANGRGPTTNGMYFKPGDAHSLYVRTTFGLVISHDDGCTFDWVCEDNIGYTGVWDPDYALTADGTIYATTPHGLRVSHDGACSFATVTADELVAALDLSSTGAVWIATATVGGSNDVYQAIDGATFQSVGLASTVALFKSLKVAPTDAMRVYVTSSQSTATLPDGGQSPPETHLFRSDDAGSQWTAEPLTGVTLAPFPLVRVGAVDPVNEDVVYVMSVGANQSTGDLLFRSTDGAVTFTQVLATANEIRDIVIVDAQHVYVTTTIHLANGSQTGGPAFVSTTGGLEFAPLPGAPLLDCLARKPDGTLEGCGANWEPDFMAVTKSPDAASWQKVWRFVELHGPLACPAGTAQHDTCDAMLWAGIQNQFGTTGPACGADASDGAQDGPPPPKKPGCCDSSGGAPMSLLWASAIALWLVRRRSA